MNRTPVSRFKYCSFFLMKKTGDMNVLKQQWPSLQIWAIDRCARTTPLSLISTRVSTGFKRVIAALLTLSYFLQFLLYRLITNVFDMASSLLLYIIKLLPHHCRHQSYHNQISKCVEKWNITFKVVRRAVIKWFSWNHLKWKCWKRFS